MTRFDRHCHEIPGVLQAVEPEEGVPLVLDSPHSGTVLPPDFQTLASNWQLRQNVDIFVDELFADAVNHGAGLLRALFPRTYIDTNRAEDEIDPALLASSWPTTLRETQKTRIGMGLLRGTIAGGKPMYDRLLSVEEVVGRIDTYYRPYHQFLTEMLERAHTRDGNIWHINCHSMKSVGSIMSVDKGIRRPDLTVSDLEGTSSDPAFTAHVADLFRAKGYDVRLNYPYKGAELIERNGDPTGRRHSIQIEINRALYIDERTYEKSDGFEPLRRDVSDAMKHLIVSVEQWTRNRQVHKIGMRGDAVNA